MFANSDMHIIIPEDIISNFTESNGSSITIIPNIIEIVDIITPTNQLVFSICFRFIDS